MCEGKDAGGGVGVGQEQANRYKSGCSVGCVGAHRCERKRGWVCVGKAGGMGGGGAVVGQHLHKRLNSGVGGVGGTSDCASRGPSPAAARTVLHMLRPHFYVVLQLMQLPAPAHSLTSCPYIVDARDALHMLDPHTYLVACRNKVSTLTVSRPCPHPLPLPLYSCRARCPAYAGPPHLPGGRQRLPQDAKGADEPEPHRQR